MNQNDAIDSNRPENFKDGLAQALDTDIKMGLEYPLIIHSFDPKAPIPTHR